MATYDAAGRVARVYHRDVRYVIAPFGMRDMRAQVRDTLGGISSPSPGTSGEGWGGGRACFQILRIACTTNGVPLNTA